MSSERPFQQHILSKAGSEAGRNLADAMEVLSSSEAKTYIKQAASLAGEKFGAAIDEEDMAALIAQQHVLGEIIDLFFPERNDFTTETLRSVCSDMCTAGVLTPPRRTKNMDALTEEISARLRISKSSEEFQMMLKEIWNSIFCYGFEMISSKYGITYTPMEIVDFLCRSADYLHRKHFGRGIDDSETRIADPFTGTGIFPARILGIAAETSENMKLRCKKNLFCRELVPAAWHIAGLNISAETARFAGESDSFYKHADLGDTFEGTEHEGSLSGILEEYTAWEGDLAPMDIVIGNPPYSRGQRNANDGMPNDVYPAMRRKLAERILKHVPGVTGSSLHNLYIYSLLWGENSIADQGIIAFVFPSTWIRTLAGKGVRLWMERNFSEIWIVDMAGDARITGDEAEKEGGSVFSPGIMSPVGMFLLVKNPESESCDVRYTRVPDGMTSEKKLEWAKESFSVEHIKKWQRLFSDENGDWFGKTDEEYKTFLPAISLRAGKNADRIFEKYALGVCTKRDYLAYNSSRDKLLAISEKAADIYEKHVNDNIKPSPQKNIDIIKWGDQSMASWKAKKALKKNPIPLRKVLYRPFMQQWLHLEPAFNGSSYAAEQVQPEETDPCLYIIMAGYFRAQKQPFSAWAESDILCDMFACGPELTPRLFPRGIYIREDRNSEAALFSEDPANMPYSDLPDEYRRGCLTDWILSRIANGKTWADNISDRSLEMFREAYPSEDVHKDCIFVYLYGIMHHKEFVSKYIDSLWKLDLRVPFSSDFRKIADLGYRLMADHVQWQTRMSESFVQPDSPWDREAAASTTKPYFSNERSALYVNDNLRFSEIPEECHMFSVAGRSPLEWFAYNYQRRQFFVETQNDRSKKIRQTKGKPLNSKAAIVNDPADLYRTDSDVAAEISKLAHLGFTSYNILQELERCSISHKETRL